MVIVDRLARILPLLGLFALTACGGGGGGGGGAPPAPTYTIGGTVTGLTGSGLVLQNNGGGSLSISANGSFTFATAVASGSSYSVSVATQPSSPTQICAVTNVSGAVAGANINNVQVTCTNAYTIGGTVSGLAGSGLVLRNNGGENLSISANGSFTFATALLNGASYSITVLAQPSSPAQTCTVTNGAGTLAGANVTNVQVSCVTNPPPPPSSYTIGGTVSGLSGTGLVLRNNGGDNLAIGANGSFTFNTAIASGSTYSVSVLAQPSSPSQTCTVTNGSGTVGSANVTNVAITCVTNTYTIGGTVTGLSGSGLVLRNNGSDNLAIGANGSFTFATSIASGATYSVSVFTQPSSPTQVCTVTNGSGTVAGANITNVQVSCVTNTYTIGGTVSGLSGTGLVLQNNSSDNLSISANGSFTFATSIASGAAYSVSVFTQPSAPTQTCTVTNGAGTVASANITNIQVSCITNTYSIGGTVSGLSGTGLVLRNNGGDNLSIGANGSFTFATSIASGATYSVSVFTQPSSPAQTCTVTSGAGTVASANIANVQVSCVNVYTIGGTVSGLSGTGLVLQNNSSDNLSISANGSFTFNTAIASGASYASTVLTQPSSPTQNCTVTNGSGTVASANVSSVTLNCVDIYPRFAYVANYSDHTVSIYSVNATTGQLRHNGYVATGSYPYSVTVDPSGKFAYVANSGSSNVSAYTINATSGVLTSVGAAVAAGTSPQSVTVDPSGKFAYVANATSNNVSAYTINATSGVLTAVAGSPFAAQVGPRSVTVDPSGKFAYVANGGSSNVSAYTINATSGVLTSVGAAVAAGANAYSVTVDPSGQFAYVANFSSSNVSTYSINPTTGVLTSVGAVAAGANPISVTVDPSGKFAYVANYGSSNASAYTINASTGALTSVGAAVAAGTNPNSVTVDPSGKFAYVANFSSNNVSAYTINASTGALTSLGTVRARAGSISIAMSKGTTAATYTPKFAYVANYTSHNVSAYTIHTTTGALTDVAGSPFAAGGNPFSVTVDPSGKFAYVANYTSNDVSAYTINATSGILTNVSAVAAGTNPYSVVVDPSGKFAYVANAGSNNVSAYTINATSGVLTSVGAVATGTTPYSVTVDPSGRFAYVANVNSNNVSAYSINATTGVLTSIGAAVAAGTNPYSVVVDPSGQFAYVANGVSNTVSAYTINATSGVLTSVGAMATGTSPLSVVVDPSGKFAYVANAGSNNVSAYTINATSGVLTSVGAVATGTTPYSVTVDPSGQFAYVANANSNNVSVYTINPTSGVLTSVGAAVAAANPYSVVTTGTIQ